MIDYVFGVSLSTLKEENLEKYRLARNSPAIYRWCRQIGLISEIDQKNWFIRQNSDPKIQMFEINAPANKKSGLVGVTGLTDIDLINGRAEFSLYIMPEFQGLGLADPALKTIFKFGFNTLNLNSIWGETFDGNIAASVFEKLGMKKDGYRREFYYKEGQYIGATIYSLLRSECSFL